MEYVTWTEDFSVGVDVFDEEHKRLIGYINALHEGIEGGLVQAEIKKIIEELADYTFYHFRNEEEKMNKFSYPGYAEHKKEHNELMIRVKSFSNKYESREPNIPLELKAFLRTWIIHHILNIDMKYKRFFRENTN